MFALGTRIHSVWSNTERKGYYSECDNNKNSLLFEFGFFELNPLKTFCATTACVLTRRNEQQVAAWTYFAYWDKIRVCAF